MNVILYFTLILGFIIVYHHLIYPLLLRLLSCVCRQRTVFSAASLPSIHLILPAYNEAGVIADKIRNVAALDYPPDKLTVSLICDGCSDDTAAIAKAVAKEPACARLSLNIEEHHKNRGKIAVLNQAIEQSSADIVALSDISALICNDGLRLAARQFQNPAVGVVNSSYQFAHASSEAEQAYWCYQSRVKQMETNTGSVIGAHGALYFFRRHLFDRLPVDTINDDFILPMRIVEQGYLAVHDSRIVATELECVKVMDNNHRRMRIAAGNLQQAIRLRGLLRPAFKGVAFNFLSGKVLRVFMPICLILFCLSSLLLSFYHPLFFVLSMAQTLFYGLALLVHFLLQRQQQPNRLLSLVYYIASGYWYSLVGMIHYLAKSRTFKV